MNNTKTCADSIVDALITHGVDTIFGLPGAQTYELIEALRKRKDEIRFIVSRHEQGAAYMAFGYAKSTGKVGVYTVVPGPGVLNTTAALCTSHNTKVLCLAGQIPSDFIGAGHGMLHELRDQLATLKTLCKWASRINHSAEVPTVMSDAFKQLNSGRPQPVAVEVPGDVLAMPADRNTEYPIADIPVWKPSPQNITEAAKLIATADNPTIMVGSGAMHAADEVLELAKVIQAPVVSFRGGRGIVDARSPYAYNSAAGYSVWDKADLVIGIGSRLELPAFRWQDGKPRSILIRIDIDPTQMVRLKANVEIVADSKLSTAALVSELQSMNLKRPDRSAEFQAVKDKAAIEVNKIQPQMSFLDTIRDVLPEDGFLVEEISQMGFTAWFGFPFYSPGKFITSGYQGNLGHGFQTALGVKTGNPDTAVVSITGDGGFMFGVQELATAVQYKISLVVILFNNNAYGNVRRDQKNLYEDSYASDLRNPDFIALAKSFGAHTATATSPDELKDILAEALQTDDGPTFIEIPVETGSESSPWKFIMPAGYGK